MVSRMLSIYEHHIWARLNARPDMVVPKGSIWVSKVVSRSDGSKFQISYKMSVTVSRVTPMKESPDQEVRLEAVEQERLIKSVGEELVKSRQRVSDHGEVFTPGWVVEEMLNLVKDESERIDSRFLEPACGSGNFLKAVLERKLKTVQSKYGKSEFEKQHHALFSLMCIYGIELLADNVAECRENLLEIYVSYLNIDATSKLYFAAEAVLKVNIIQADALTLSTTEGAPIQFPEWSYIGAGKFQRRDFRYDALTQRSSIQGTLFELFEEHQLFVPTRTYPSMSIESFSK